MPGQKRPRAEDEGSQPKLQFGINGVKLFTSNQFENASPEHVLQTIWGYKSFRGKQLQAIQQVVAGYSTVVLFPTGAGTKNRRHLQP
jgi:superfamily II DNA helicase RecQ